MWQKNNGQSDTDILQNQFTTYLVRAIQRRRGEYLRQMEKQKQAEELVESHSPEMEPFTIEDMLSGLPLWMQLENHALFQALKELDGRERYIFFARVLDEKGFQSLAGEMHLSYSGVAAIYYRTVKKIAKKMEGIGI